MFLDKVKERVIWSLHQMFTIKHLIGMILFVILFTCNSSEIPIEKLLMTIVFIIFCTYEQLGYAIVSGIIIGIIIGIFPFLSIFIPFLIIGGVVKNLKFIWKNLYAVYLSIAVVMLPSTLLDVILGDFYSILIMPVTKVIEIISSWKLIYIITNTLGISYETVVIGIFFNIMMFSLYSMKYSTKEAFTAIGMFPLLLLSLLIPAIMNEIATAINTTTYDAMYNSSYNNPGIHNVNGYYRTNKFGEVEYVDSHIRTNPDGIEYNNLSFRE